MDIDIDFEIDYGNEEENEQDNSEFVKIKHEIKSVEINYLKAYDLAQKINIKKNESIYLMLDGGFIFGDFIGAFIQENNLDVVELTVISLSGGEEVFEMFEELINKKWVKKINLMLSGYYLRTERAKRSRSIQLLEEIKIRKKENFNIYYTNTHQKIVLIKTKGGGHVTMHGSANLKSSQSLEQLFIQENKKLYDFNYQYFINLINK